MHNSVRAWLADIDKLDVDDAHVDHLLSPEERARSQRFAFETLRRRFRIRRAALRLVLAHVTGRPAASLMFSTLFHGKPLVEDGPEFNASNSGPMLLIVVGTHVPLGADIEVLSDLDDMDKLSSAYFSPSEQNALSMLEGLDRRRGFFQIWTRKEAVLKAVGLGLNMDLRSISVPLADLGISRSGEETGSKTRGCLEYFVRSLYVGSECEASIASRTPVALEGIYRLEHGLEWRPQSMC